VPTPIERWQEFGRRALAPFAVWSLDLVLREIEWSPSLNIHRETRTCDVPTCVAFEESISDDMRCSEFSC
jgi:hypothetical protein